MLEFGRSLIQHFDRVVRHRQPAPEGTYQYIRELYDRTPLRSYWELHIAELHSPTDGATVEIIPEPVCQRGGSCFDISIHYSG